MGKKINTDGLKTMYLERVSIIGNTLTVSPYFKIFFTAVNYSGKFKSNNSQPLKTIFNYQLIYRHFYIIKNKHAFTASML